jgi:hypothetical protein
MVLVTSQGCATRESLLAIRVWALIGSLSRMDSTMTCQGARVAERLGSGLGRAVKQVMPGTYLSAALTHVRLLAGVNTLVNRQSRPLNKLFAAVGILAHVRTDAAMDAFCRIVSVTTFWCCGPSSLP